MWPVALASQTASIKAPHDLPKPLGLLRMVAGVVIEEARVVIKECHKRFAE